MTTTNRIDIDSIMERYDIEDDTRRIRVAASKAQRIRRDSRGKAQVQR